MEEINEEMKEVDVVMVIGANDTVREICRYRDLMDGKLN